MVGRWTSLGMSGDSRGGGKGSGEDRGESLTQGEEGDGQGECHYRDCDAREKLWRR